MTNYRNEHKRNLYRISFGVGMPESTHTSLKEALMQVNKVFGTNFDTRKRFLKYIHRYNSEMFGMSDSYKISVMVFNRYGEYIKSIIY